MPRRKCKYESLTIIQAYHKNSAEEAQLNVVNKYLNQEKKRLAEDIERNRKSIKATIEKVRRTRPIPGATLRQFHEEQAQNIQDVCVHIVHSYMNRQDKNKEAWRVRMKAQREEGMITSERPVTTPDHLMFVRRAFPEIYNFTVGYDWTYNKASNVDIYEHGRAGHDMKCMSTRSKPIGNYGHRCPVNFRLWDQVYGPPEPDLEREEALKRERRKKMMNRRDAELQQRRARAGASGKHLPAIDQQNVLVDVPSLGGIAYVGKNHVTVVQDKLAPIIKGLRSPIMSATKAENIKAALADWSKEPELMPVMPLVKKSVLSSTEVRKKSKPRALPTVPVLDDEAEEEEEEDLDVVIEEFERQQQENDSRASSHDIGNSPC